MTTVRDRAARRPYTGFPMTTRPGRSAPPSVRRLERTLAATLLRSRLDYNEGLGHLHAFFHDLRPGLPATAEELSAAWAARRGEAGPGHLYTVYLNVPFCRSRCLFCMYPSMVAGDGAIRDYLTDLESEAGFFSRALAGQRIVSFFVGGGTPSMLSASRLDRALGMVSGLFDLEPGGLRSVECNPDSADAAKLRTLRRHGFNRLSLGVQSLEPSVLSRIGRGYQTADSVVRAVRRAREAGFEEINVDLMFGFLGETAEGIRATLLRLTELRPSTITVCGLTATDGYLKANGLDRSGYARYYASVLPGALDALRDAGEAAGYRIPELRGDTPDWILTLPAERRPNPEDRRGSTLGLARHSRSSIFGRLRYERLAGPFAPDAPVYRAHAQTVKDEMAAFILERLDSAELGASRVPLSAFRARFGEDLGAVFGLELAALRCLGKAEVKEDELRFLPRGMSERVLYGMFFLLDALAASPFSAGRLDERLRADLSAELG